MNTVTYVYTLLHHVRKVYICIHMYIQQKLNTKSISLVISSQQISGKNSESK